MNRIPQTTCCFTGHRTIPAGEVDTVVAQLHKTILELISEGYNHFLSGGAVGFDLVAASLIVALKQQGFPVQLEFVLPCNNHDEYWGEKQKQLLRNLRNEADMISILEDNYTDGCMKRRNQHMVSHSNACIAYLRRTASGTGQTVRYARAKGLRLFIV